MYWRLISILISSVHISMRLLYIYGFCGGKLILKTFSPMMVIFSLVLLKKFIFFYTFIQRLKKKFLAACATQHVGF